MTTINIMAGGPHDDLPTDWQQLPGYGLASIAEPCILLKRAFSRIWQLAILTH